MNIIEATKKAMESGKGIVNTKCKEIDVYLLPTNTNECYLVIPNDYSVTNERRACPRWNPHAIDILLDDWEINE